MFQFLSILLIYAVGVVIAYICIFANEYFMNDFIEDEYKRREFALDSIEDNDYHFLAILSWLSVILIIILGIYRGISKLFYYIAKKLIRIGIKEENK